MNQVWGNKNPRNPETRWFLGAAIKGRLRAVPYPATHRQKDAALKAMEGLHEKEEKLMRRTIALFTAMAMMVLLANGERKEA